MRYTSTTLYVVLGVLIRLTTALKIAASLGIIEYTPEVIANQDYFNNSATFVNGGVAAILSDTSIDLATNAETQALRQYGTHKNLRIIYTVTESYYRIVANKAKGINTLADLKGRRIGSFPVTSAAYFTYKYLATVGLGASDYTIVPATECKVAPCGAGTFPYMLSQGTVDAVAMWEPSVQLSIEALGSNAIVFNTSDYRECVNLHSTTEKLADPTIRASIVEFVRALTKTEAVFASDGVASDAGSIIPRVSSTIGVSTSVLEAVWPHHAWRGTLAPDLLDVMEIEDKWVAQQEGRAAMTRADIAGLIDSSILAESLQT
jgi:hypothetical protein